MRRATVPTLALLFFCFFSCVFGVRVTFHNLFDESIVIYWERFGSSPTANGLKLMDVVEPRERVSFETNIGHSFEVRDVPTIKTIDILQVNADNSEFIVDGVRQCGPYEKYSFSFTPLPYLTSCPYSIWNDYLQFIRIGLPLHRARQVVHYGEDIMKRREEIEERRHYLNRVQPGLSPMYTKYGYEVRQLPEVAWNALRTFWQENKHKMELEIWDDPANHHVNHWESPSYTLFLPQYVINHLINAIKPILEEWIGGKSLIYTTCYGIRAYTNGSILLNHVDRGATHAVSSIIQVDQRVNEDWLLEVHGNDGVIKHVKLLPGQIALYESARLIHGREKRLNGDYFANVFIHFRPRDWSVPQL